tara:strand:+ start:184 stop:918 length:735 start_codon:yes stop_codon:yes gene_type:complete
MENWYKTWFNTKYYHILYKNRDYFEATYFIDNLLNELKPKNDSIFLDLACGSGRHAVYLNRKGFYVDGVDLSGKSLLLARKSQNKKLNFYKQDMRLFKRDNHYDIVLNLFTSIGYFKNKIDNENIFINVDKSLKNNGYFIIDFLNSIQVINSFNNKEELKTIQGIQFNIEKYHNNDFIFKKISITDKKNKFIFTEKVQLLTKDDFLNFADKTNLKLISFFGNYDLNKFDKNSSRLIMIFKKQIQ